MLNHGERREVYEAVTVELACMFADLVTRYEEPEELEKAEFVRDLEKDLTRHWDRLKAYDQIH